MLNDHKFRFNRSSYTILETILILLRAIPISITMLLVICFQQYVRPYIMLPSLRRYLSCIVNLIGLRIVLLCLGVITFDSDGYRYFSKTYIFCQGRGHMLTYKSGWIGVSNHKNILDFIYYSYLFNPTYVLPIFFKQEEKIRYTPISFKQAFFASLTHRGFEPLQVKNQSQLKKLKCRKMTMQTLVSECFEEMNGPIMIMLPGIFPKQHIKIQKMIGMDMHENQRKCLRSGVVFISSVEPKVNDESNQAKFINQMTSTVYTNQLHLIADCLSKFCSIKLNIFARQIISKQYMEVEFKYQYNKDTYSNFIDQFFVEAGYKFSEINYLDYKKKIDQVDQLIQQSK